MTDTREIEGTADTPTPSTEIVHRAEPGAGSLVQLVAPTNEIVRVFQQYQETKKALLDDSDYQRAGSKTFVKRSGWRKLAIAFGVSFEIVDKKQILDSNGDLDFAEFTIRAMAPNGRYADGWGACSADEKCCMDGCDKGGTHDHCPAQKGEPCTGKRHFTKPRHDIPATAETRAKNRAAADLFGMGEVSAEEVGRDGGGYGGGSSADSGQGQPEKLTDHKCPSCGTAVLDQNAKVDADIADKGESKTPRWKCSSKTCTGGRDGKYSWASWQADEFGPPPEPPHETLLNFVTMWIADGETSMEDLVKLATESIRNTEAVRAYAGPEGDVATLPLEDLPTEVLSDIYTELKPERTEDEPPNDGGYG